MRAQRRRRNQKNGRKQDDVMALKLGASRGEEGATALNVTESESRGTDPNPHT